MKNLKLSVIGLVLGMALRVSGQSIPSDVYSVVTDTLVGPWAVAGGWGHNITGEGRSATFGIISYNLVASTNGMGFNSGPIAGYDVTYGAGKTSISTLSGGWDASWTGKPFSFIGKTFVTNITGSAMAFQLVATPRGGSAIGAITGTAFTLDVYSFDNFHIKPLGIYESRNGMDEGNGNWLFGGLAITHDF